MTKTNFVIGPIPRIDRAGALVLRRCLFRRFSERRFGNRHAIYEIGRRTLSGAGSFRIFNREAHVEGLANREAVFFESLEGLEARVDGQSVAVLRDYRPDRQMVAYRQNEIPPGLHFEPCASAWSPRIAVANRP